MQAIFQRIYDNNEWHSDESVSGQGSTLKQTAAIRAALPDLFRRLKVRSLLDIPCGDLNWMGAVELGDIKYIGADIVPEIIEQNSRRYDLHNVDFMVLDITRDLLPEVDLVLCRDLLGHFSSRDVQRALTNIKNSRVKYLLSTTFPDHESFGDIQTGHWRPINLASFFGLPDPIEIINEGYNGKGLTDKSLGLWRLS